MQRIVEVIDLIVNPVDGNGVLDQIIGADGKEIQMANKDVGADCGGGDLDHRPYGEVPIIGNTLLIQFRPDIIDQIQDLHRFLQIGQHWYHQAQGAVGRGPQYGTKLRSEQ